MKTYIDSKKLIAEIEKILSRADKEEKQAFLRKDGNRHIAAVTKTAVCSKIKKLVTSLQQEQPPRGYDEAYLGEQSEVDFEKDAVSYCYDNGINISPRQAKGIARHFYELGLNARKEETK